MKAAHLKGNWNEIKGKIRYSYDDSAEIIFAQDEFLDGRKNKVADKRKKQKVKGTDIM